MIEYGRPGAALADFFVHNPRVALAFSGGCDSAYVFYAAVSCGADVRAYYVHSAFQPAFELEDARRLARELQREITVLEVDVLGDARVCANPPDRCYHCKQRIFSAIQSAAKRDGYACILDGTNASDDAADRPGMRALKEMQVLSPLRECGVDKATVRCLSQEAGLFTWNKPAYACLATRIPTGTAIRAEDLARVERGEARLHGLGFRDLRVRLNKRGARIELPDGEMAEMIARRDEVLAALRDDFDVITLDLRARGEN